MYFGDLRIYSLVNFLNASNCMPVFHYVFSTWYFQNCQLHNTQYMATKPYYIYANYTGSMRSSIDPSEERGVVSTGGRSSPATIHSWSSSNNDNDDDPTLNDNGTRVFVCPEYDDSGGIHYCSEHN